MLITIQNKMFLVVRIIKFPGKHGAFFVCNDEEERMVGQKIVSIMNAKCNNYRSCYRKRISIDQKNNKIK